MFINGHGNDSEITGHDYETLVKIGENEYLLAGRITYARSCSAAKVLGENVAENNSTTFIGYNRSYILGRNPLKVASPLDDEVAKLFLEPSNLIPISIIKGRTAEEAYNKSQEAMRKNFSFMLSSKATSNQRDAAVYLWSNLSSQVLLGDKLAHL